MANGNGFEKAMLLDQGERIYKKLNEIAPLSHMDGDHPCAPAFHNPVVDRINDITPAVAWLVQYRVSKERATGGSWLDTTALKWGKATMTYRLVVLLALVYWFASIHGIDVLSPLMKLFGVGSVQTTLASP